MAEVALPAFILGYHGCDASIAELIFTGQATLKISSNDYDWLGDGIYFWEHNPQRAFDFACELAERPHPSQQKIRNPAVVGAVIDLGYCLNLLDSRFIEMVRQAYNDLSDASKAAGIPLPENTGGPDLLSRKLDCAVIRTLHQDRIKAGELPFDTVRAAFLEGERLYEKAGFAAKSHIQVCVRRHSSILGYFRPLDEDGKPLTYA